MNPLACSIRRELILAIATAWLAAAGLAPLGAQTPAAIPAPATRADNDNAAAIATWDERFVAATTAAERGRANESLFENLSPAGRVRWWPQAIARQLAFGRTPENLFEIATAMPQGSPELMAFLQSLDPAERQALREFATKFVQDYARKTSGQPAPPAPPPARVTWPEVSNGPLFCDLSRLNSTNIGAQIDYWYCLINRRGVVDGPVIGRPDPNEPNPPATVSAEICRRILKQQPGVFHVSADAGGATLYELNLTAAANLGSLAGEFGLGREAERTGQIGAAIAHMRTAADGGCYDAKLWLVEAAFKKRITLSITELAALLRECGMAGHRQAQQAYEKAAPLAEAARQRAEAFAAALAWAPMQSPAEFDLAKWRERAGRGEGAAMVDLAWCYRLGAGVPRDQPSARWWEEQAQRAGIVIPAGGAAPEAAFARALRLAEQGSVMAQVEVGVDYGDGIGVKADPAQASRWFQAAAAQDHAQAKALLALSLNDAPPAATVMQSAPATAGGGGPVPATAPAAPAPAPADDAKSRARARLEAMRAAIEQKMATKEGREALLKEAEAGSELIAENAVAQLQAAAKSVPPATVAQLLQEATALAQKGDWPGARAKIDTALAQDPKSDEALMARAQARALDTPRDLAGAVADVEALLRLQPNDARVRVGAAQIYLAAGLPERAKQQLREADRLGLPQAKAMLQQLEAQTTTPPQTSNVPASGPTKR
jgi:TPR repeat protein